MSNLVDFSQLFLPADCLELGQTMVFRDAISMWILPSCKTKIIDKNYIFIKNINSIYCESMVTL